MNAADIRLEVALALQSYPQPDLHDRVQFAANLRFVYHIIRASETLLRLASQLATGDLQAYYKAHLAEESGHDEWLFRDLQEAGEAVFPIPESAIELAGAQYFYLLHVSPAALLGYMVLLEGFPMTMDRVEELEILHGTALCRTLRYHAEHDVEHFADLAAVVDAQPDAQKAVIREVALFSAHRLAQAVLGDSYAC